MLFAVGTVEPEPPRHTVFAPWLEAGEPLVEDPLVELGQSLRRIEARLERLDPSGTTAEQSRDVVEPG